MFVKVKHRSQPSYIYHIDPVCSLTNVTVGVVIVAGSRRHRCRCGNYYRRCRRSHHRRNSNSLRRRRCSCIIYDVVDNAKSGKSIGPTHTTNL